MGGPLVTSGGVRTARRSLTPVIGLVLLIGLVAAVSVGIFVVATDGVSSSEAEADRERAEQTFTGLSGDLESTAAGDGVAGETELNFQDGDRVDVREDATEISLWVNASTNGPDGDEHDWTVSTVEYVADDGTPVTFENGAVWRGDGNETQLVSAPGLAISDDAVTLPVLDPHAEESLYGSIGMERTADRYPENLSQYPAEEITLEIESDYHAGWADYLESAVGDRGQVTHHANGTVTADLGGEPEGYEPVTRNVTTPLIEWEDGYFDDVATIDGDLDHRSVANQFETDGTVTTAGSIDDGLLNTVFGVLPWTENEAEAYYNDGQPIERDSYDDAIRTTVDQADENDWTTLDDHQTAEIGFGDRFGLGLTDLGREAWNSLPWTFDQYTFESEETYYLEEWDQDRLDEVTIDVADNDVTIVVDDDFKVDGIGNRTDFSDMLPDGFLSELDENVSTTDIEVANADSGNNATIYVTGDASFDSATACVDNCDYVSGTYVTNAFESDPPEEAGAESLRLFGTSETVVSFDGASFFEGVISAPPGEESGVDPQLESSGQATLVGAIDVGDADLWGNVDLIYDEDVREIELPEMLAHEETEEIVVGHEPIGDLTYVTVPERQVALSND